MGNKSAADLYAEEIHDSPLRRLGRKVVKQREIIKKLRQQRKRWVTAPCPWCTPLPSPKPDADPKEGK